MKRIKILIVAAAALLIGGCSKGLDVIINVDGYEGIVLKTETAAITPVPIPSASVSADASVPEGSDNTDNNGTAQTTPDVSQSSVPEETDVQTVHTEPPVVTEPPAAWDETPANGTMYVNTDGIYSRIAAIQGSSKVKKYGLNDAVGITAKTNTGYYKTESGSYIHSDYLSTTTVTVQTSAVSTELPPEETTPPDVTTSGFVTSVTENPPIGTLTPIMGNSSATVEQMRRYIRKMNPDVADSVIEMIPYYISEGSKEGVRGDIAFAQSCVETGYFRFDKAGTGSAVTIDQNNFCGMGVTSLGIKGESFATPQLGIRAQIQHLKAYASTEPLNGVCVDNRFQWVQRGCAEYVEWLGIQENPIGKGWAGGKNYGKVILNVYNNIIST